MWKKYWQRVCEVTGRLFGKNSIWNLREKITRLVTAIALVLFLCWFFYRSIAVLPVLLPVGVFYLLGKEKDDRRKKKEDLRRQFKDMIQSLAASLRAGYAVENAFSESYGEMLSLYGRDSEICSALRRILLGLKNNMTVETLMEQFARASGVEEVYEFAEVFRAAKKSGGNLAEIMDKTAGMIGERIDTADEIKVAIAAKEMEQKIMNVVPFGIVFYISLTSPGFFDGLFGNLTGFLIMSGCLGLYLGAYILGQKMTRFESA